MTLDKGMRWFHFLVFQLYAVMAFFSIPLALIERDLFGAICFVAAGLFFFKAAGSPFGENTD